MDGGATPPSQRGAVQGGRLPVSTLAAETGVNHTNPGSGGGSWSEPEDHPDGSEETGQAENIRHHGRAGSNEDLSVAGESIKIT